MKIFYRSAKEAKNNKSWEIQVEWVKPSIASVLNFDLKLGLYWSLYINIARLFELVFSRTKEQDHAGITFHLDILGFFIYYTYHDIRHWNYEEDRWETQEEIDQQNEDYNNSLKQNNESNN